MPTMNVSLTAEFVKFIETAVEEGRYASASEVVRDALRLLKTGHEERELRLERLRREVQVGLDQMENGEFSDRSVDDIFDAVTGKVRA